MIKTVLNVDDICQDCPYFSMETNHATSYDGSLHMIYISCEHRDLCNYLKNILRRRLIKMIKLEHVVLASPERMEIS